MARVTKTQLRDMVSYLQRDGVDIMISWAYGKPRCYTKDESRELSPRLPTGEMALWLDGYSKGYYAGHKNANDSWISSEYSTGPDSKKY